MVSHGHMNDIQYMQRTPAIHTSCLVCALCSSVVLHGTHYENERKALTAWYYEQYHRERPVVLLASCYSCQVGILAVFVCFLVAGSLGWSGYFAVFDQIFMSLQYFEVSLQVVMCRVCFVYFAGPISDHFYWMKGWYIVFEILTKALT